MRNVMFETLIHNLGSASSRIRRALWFGGCALAAAYLVGCTGGPPPPGYQTLSVSVSGLLPDTSVDVGINMGGPTGSVVVGYSPPENSGDILAV